MNLFFHFPSNSFSLKNTLLEKSSQIDKDLEEFEELLERISGLQNGINLLTERVSELYVFGENQTQIEQDLISLESDVNETFDQSIKLAQQTRDKFTKQQGFVPTDITQELKSLELAAEHMQATMTDKGREFKRAKTVRSEYLTNVDCIQNWLQQAELRIQDRTLEPQQLKEILNNAQTELTNIYEKLDTVKQCAIVIVDKSRSDDEKKLVQNTVDQLVKQIDQFRLELEEKKHQIHNSLDACTRFMKLYEIVMKWAREKRQFLEISLNVTTLPEARQKMNDYMVN